MDDPDKANDSPVDEIEAIEESNMVSASEGGDRQIVQVDAEKDTVAADASSSPGEVLFPRLPYRSWPRPDIAGAAPFPMASSTYRVRGHLYKSQLSVSLPDLSSYIQHQKGLPLRYEQITSSFHVHSMCPNTDQVNGLKLPLLANVQPASPTGSPPKLLSWGHQNPRTKRALNVYVEKPQFHRERSMLNPMRSRRLSQPSVDNHHLLLGSMLEDKFEERHLWRPRYKPDCPCNRCETHRQEWQARKRRFDKNEQRDVPKPTYPMGGVYLQGGTIT